MTPEQIQAEVVKSEIWAEGFKAGYASCAKAWAQSEEKKKVKEKEDEKVF